MNSNESILLLLWPLAILLVALLIATAKPKGEFADVPCPGCGKRPMRVVGRRDVRQEYEARLNALLKQEKSGLRRRHLVRTVDLPYHEESLICDKCQSLESRLLYD